MKHLLILLTVTLLFTFCSNPKNNIKNIERIEINSNTEKKEIPLSGFVKNIRILTLETTTNSLIKEITKLVELENEIFIFDRPSNCILKFDKNGRFIDKLYRPGKGPGEYIVLIDIVVIDDELLVLDFTSRKVKCYNSHNFSYYYEFKLPDGAIEMFEIEGKLLFYCASFTSKTSNNSPHFVSCRFDGSSPKKLLESKFSQSSIQFMGSTIFCGNGLFSRSYESVIYQFNNNFYAPVIKYEIDFGSKEVHEDLTNKKILDKDFPYFYRYKTYNLENQLIFDFFRKMVRQYCFYDKKTKKSIWGPIINDVKYGSILPFFPSFLTSKGLVGVLHPDIFIDKLNKEKIEDLNKLKSTDNPILVYYDF